MFLFAAVIFMIPDLAISAEKSRDWQTGKVLDSQRSRYFAGTVSNANTTGTAQANGNLRYVERQYKQF